MTGSPEENDAPDRGLNTMLKWVFGALVISVVFGIIVVELTLRWFRP